MELNNEFCGVKLIPIQELQERIRQHEGLPVEVQLCGALVYPDGRIPYVPHPRRSKGSMSVKKWIAKLRRDYPGLDFVLPIHGRTRLDTARDYFARVRSVAA